MAEDFISSREFERTMNSMDEKIDTGFKTVHEKLDQLSPLVLEHAKAIAVLEFQAEQSRKTALAAKNVADDVHRSTSYRATAYGSGASAAIWVLIQVAGAVKRYFTGH